MKTLKQRLEYKRNWYNKNKERVLNYNRKWRKKNKGKWNRIIIKLQHKRKKIMKNKKIKNQKRKLRAQKLIVDTIINCKDRKAAIKVSKNVKIDSHLRTLLIREFLI